MMSGHQKIRGIIDGFIQASFLDLSVDNQDSPEVGQTILLYMFGAVDMLCQIHQFDEKQTLKIYTELLECELGEYTHSEAKALVRVIVESSVNPDGQVIMTEGGEAIRLWLSGVALAPHRLIELLNEQNRQHESAVDMALYDAAYSSLRHSLFEFLEKYVAIHDKIFNQKKGIFNRISQVVKHMDFDLFAESLTNVSSGLSLFGPQLNPRVERERIMLEYASALRETVDCLLQICKKLSAKADGQSYPLKDYQLDLKQYTSLADRYMRLGVDLNKIVQN